MNPCLFRTFIELEYEIRLLHLTCCITFAPSDMSSGFPCIKTS